MFQGFFCEVYTFPFLPQVFPGTHNGKGSNFTIILSTEYSEGDSQFFFDQIHMIILSNGFTEMVETFKDINFFMWFWRVVDVNML